MSLGAEALETGSGVRFTEFLQFVVDEGRGGRVDGHWRSIHDQCHPCSFQYDFIAKLETIEEDSQLILSRINNKTIEFPDKKLGPITGNSTQQNSTKTFLEYYSTVSEKTLQGIRNLYWLDFKLFGYDERLNQVATIK